MGMKFSHEMKPLLADDFCFYRGTSFFYASNHVIIKYSLCNELKGAYERKRKRRFFMIQSLAFILLLGLIMAEISKRLKLPRIVGMLFTGIVLGPFVLNLLDPKILSISAELRQIALLIILIKAGLSLDLKDLKKASRPALLLSFLPASFEILGYALLAPILLKISTIDALLMGAVLSAVSPAVVVPRMSMLMDEGYGTDKAIPQMIMAGASMDDIFVIVLFTSFLGMAMGQGVDLSQFANIPISIVLGIAIGAVFGLVASFVFEKSFSKKHLIRNSMKVIIIMALSFLLVAIEGLLKEKLAISSLIAVVTMAMTIRIKSVESVSARLSAKFAKLWIAAEVMLFVLVGAEVDIRYTLDAGLMAIVMIFLALAFRTVGVLIALAGTGLNKKEKLFTVFSYLPKATVQAAIGSVPLAMGLESGKIILSVAALAILITAPLGATMMDLTYKKFLNK